MTLSFSDHRIAFDDNGLEGPIPAITRLKRRLKSGDSAVRKPEMSIAELRLSGRLNKAEARIKKALRANPNDAAALHQSALIARDKGRSRRAVQLLEMAAAAYPGAADIRCDLGLALKAIGRFEEAITAQRSVTELLPESARAWSNYGTALLAGNRPEEAVSAFIQAVALDSHDAELHYNLGNAFLRSGEPATAEGAFLRALKIKPDHMGALTNLGSALKDQGRLDEAEAILRGTAVLDPHNRDLTWNLAMVLLTAGKFEEGWAAYEARRSLPGFSVKPQKIPPWPGTPLKGKRLLVHAEQGLGDTIQFCRYLNCLPDGGDNVIFQVPTRLLPLMRSLPAQITLTDAENAGESCDIEAPLLSLPHLVGPASPMIPVTGGYLKPDPDRLVLWKDRLGKHDGPTIAISWQGNPDYRYDKSRSVPLQHFEPLTDRADTRLISVQQEPGRSQLNELSWRERIIHLGDEIDRESAFIDTAAILATVDLVITSDTSIAHLAGALGVPVWVALAKVPDWRWGLTGDTTPWYPSMRLFRQDSFGDWAPVFSNMAAALQGHF
jgi:tetratricopeptide (TPR) repeat protein